MDDDYFYFGGSKIGCCQCPDETQYLVRDNWDDGKTLACSGGTKLECNKT